ncbi:Unsaturated rhamnogalacturonyl hydrolase YesR [Paenibacillus allorhizoplanae]|uniref:Unsaturated rhamnogalacturonyl hydrolase YesR n=1 Tax=Paenibacillus allorhizoplanae TaxID=2905648 RepID=A0ABM9C253_9BACL|nr:glycoside hydrolase family 88 protein [Paenibacillus allorhizoplanae]CAH1202032.1 Unsaturated rhamnogalacturonyl hydrolase YesR [Paenibacillus allorhizoplanae]
MSNAATIEKYEHIISKLIRQMKTLKPAFQENVAIGIVSMDNWEWPQGVGLFALYSYYKETGNLAIRDELIQWFDKRIAEGLPDKNVNTMCPMLTLSYLAEETGNPTYVALCKEWVTYVMEDMPRTDEGGLQHCVTRNLNEGQLWDDTLYMTVLFVARMGVLLQDDAYFQESIRQFLVHLKYLSDVKTGLFFHGWTFLGHHHYAQALWARGNSWYTAGLVDYLDIAPLPAGVSQFLISSLERQVRTLAALQHENGLWHTLLDQPDSYLETSASSAFAYGILKAVRKGFIDERYRAVGLKALEGVMSKIDEEGIVHGVSYGTGLKDNLDYYRKIKQCPMPYGQSMALMLMVEACK